MNKNEKTSSFQGLVSERDAWEWQREYEEAVRAEAARKWRQYQAERTQRLTLALTIGGVISALLAGTLLASYLIEILR